VWCSVLQCVAVCCNVLQCEEERDVVVEMYGVVYLCGVGCCSVLQSAVVCCSVLQSAVVCCSVMQCVAVCCSYLEERYLVVEMYGVIHLCVAVYCRGV